MFFHAFFPQSFIVIALNLSLNFSRNASRLYRIGMRMLVDMLYDNLRWSVLSFSWYEWLVAFWKLIFFYLFHFSRPNLSLNGCRPLSLFRNFLLPLWKYSGRPSPLQYLCLWSVMLQVTWCQQRQPSRRIIWLTEVHLYLQIKVVEAIDLFSQIANSKTMSGSSQMLNNSLICLGAWPV